MHTVAPHFACTTATKCGMPLDRAVRRVTCKVAIQQANAGTLIPAARGSHIEDTEMKYRVQKIMQVREALDALPKASIDSKECFSSREAIALLSDSLASLQTRGYSIEMLAKELNSRGIDIALSTLRRYLKRPRPDQTTRRKRASRSAASAPTAKPGSAPSGASVPPAPPKFEKAPEPQQQQAPPEDAARSSRFDVRQDTDDL